MLSATQTPPPSPWFHYVFIYISSRRPIPHSDNQNSIINSDTHTTPIPSHLRGPASATNEGASLGLHFFIVFYPKYTNKFGRLLTYS